MPTSPYRFVDTYEDYRAAIAAVGLPCVVKPVMSSSGKGQSTVRGEAEIDAAWEYAQTGGRAGAGRCIVEGFVDFDYEITLLTVRHAGGTSFCEPIGHLQRDGDYRESWQPQPMSALALERSQAIARAVTDDLGGWGVFGVELFVKGDEVWFSEVSPRPHDTGLSDAGVAGAERVRPARARHPRPARRRRGGRGDPPERPVGFVRAAGARPWRAGVLQRGGRVAGRRHGAAPVRQAARGGPPPGRRDLTRADGIDAARAVAREAAEAIGIELRID